jgi:subtilisin family serine protease
MKRLVSADTAVAARSQRCLRRLWPDFAMKEQVDASCVTVKADAARRTFNAYGDRIVWAVIDSGIDARHPHFATHNTLRHESGADLHRLFPLEGEPDKDPELALVDESGHGTHVAGIIAGSIESWLAGQPNRTVQATESRFNVEQPNDPLRVPRQVEDVSLLAGMAPKTKLVSLKVLQAGGTQEARVARVMKALEYVRNVNGESTDSMRIHGVNLSLGYEFDPQWFACGQSPLCKEVDKLVRTGVVVVVAAGNSGFGSLAVLQDAPSRFGLGMTINDPGNAELAITVGSTHRDAPHCYGVSYFSSKGPTGDGRPKPDLVAPGERITSCAAGRNLASVIEGEVPADTAVYVEDSGTSMAAPHVSGAVAALLSVRREFIGQPERVKKIITDSAISLRRNTDFEGAGLLDLMRALQLQ